ncbi:sialic acid synthase-like [Mercenaria mercenaria]|uniref:sialic acid synthase-like n=1 Tax=Mercenaria mercenaria TaxID=6596 RepID=UPI00234E8A78|nr:sialic acid synthase-like [Mercenaria mercenaria]
MIVSFTPIRSGSKCIPHKNVRLLNGKPLFHYVTLEALKVSSLDEVWISTDCEQYAVLAPPGVQVHRRSEASSSDKSLLADVVMEFIKACTNITTIVILQATSPTTKSQDIEEALQHSASGKGCVSVQPAHVYLYHDNKPLWTARTPRQDSKTFAEDGSIYVIHVADFLKTKTIPTFPCHNMIIQHPVCDIDTEEDFKRAEALLYRPYPDMIDTDGIKCIDSYLNLCESLQISTRKQKRTMIIAEIGYNHQGNIKTAKELIRRCKDSGVDVVKLQKQDLGLDGRFTPAALQRPYLSKNSFGETYGDHRRSLELSKEDFKALQSYSKEIGIAFAASAYDMPSFDFLELLNVPFYKIASGDIGNLKLIEHVAKKGKPVILSTGMADMTTVAKSVMAVLKHNNNLTLLQCTSSYPVPDDEVQLNVIRTYQQVFPKIKIGFSGHDQGTPLTLAAVALGCKVVERHVTLDKQMKGSDHIASLDMNELATLVRDIRRIDSALGTGIKCLQPSEQTFMNKLAKRLVYTRSFAKGSIITPCDVVAKVNFQTSDDVPLVDTEWEVRELVTDVVQNENMQTNHFRSVPEIRE